MCIEGGGLSRNDDDDNDDDDHKSRKNALKTSDVETRVAFKINPIPSLLPTY